MANTFAWATLSKTQANRGVVIGEWTFTEAGVGTPVDVSCFTDLTVEVSSGTWNSTSLSVKGGLGTGAPASVLKDWDGVAITKTADFISTVRESPRLIAPTLTGGTPSLVVRIKGVATAPLA